MDVRTRPDRRRLVADPDETTFVRYRADVTPVTPRRDIWDERRERTVGDYIGIVMMLFAVAFAGILALVSRLVQP